MEITVILTDGRKLTVRPGMRDFISFERAYNVPAQDFSTEGRLEWLMYLVHSAAKRSEEVPADFDEFIALVDSVDTVEDDTDRPTEDDEAQPA